MKTHSATLSLAFVAIYVVPFGLMACGGEDEVEPYDLDFVIPRSEVFAASLSTYGVYEEPLSALQPTDRALLYELSSELFTDYAHKQRLVMVPDGSVITFEGTRLVFPEDTVLVKTFYYPVDMRDELGTRRVIETRLLVKTSGVWNAATYRWNDEQTEATLLLTGDVADVAWLDEAGEPHATDYVVPSEGECMTCHQTGGLSTFIGPTVRNWNRMVVRDGVETNQLAFLQSQGVLDEGDWPSDAAMPDYRDSTASLETRARAYLDINCAHCHNPDGWDTAPNSVDFRYLTPLAETGLARQARGVARQLENGNMPYLGTTLVHDEGVRLVLEFLDSL